MTFLSGLNFVILWQIYTHTTFLNNEVKLIFGIFSTVSRMIQQH